MMMPILSSTIALFEFADSLIPMTRMTVITATTAKAGRLKITGRLPMCGAFDHADARNCVVGSLAPAPDATNASCAER